MRLPPISILPPCLVTVSMYLEHTHNGKRKKKNEKKKKRQKIDKTQKRQRGTGENGQLILLAFTSTKKKVAKAQRKSTTTTTTTRTRATTTRTTTSSSSSSCVRRPGWGAAACWDRLSASWRAAGAAAWPRAGRFAFVHSPPRGHGMTAATDRKGNV